MKPLKDDIGPKSPDSLRGQYLKSQAPSVIELEVPLARLDIDDTDIDPGVPPASPSEPGRELAFWLQFVAICVASFLTTLDTFAIPTAQPAIVQELSGTSTYAWIGGAYTVAGAAWIPLSGGLADCLGRKSVMLSALAFFFVGSIICGEATSMAMLIAGRTVQGIGNGGINSLTEIILADVVPLNERGFFMGLTGIVFAVASAVGPPLGGVFSQTISWRWFFRLNLPITFVSAILVLVFLKVKRPAGATWRQVRDIDWLGTILLSASTVAISVGLTRGGVDVPWTSVAAILPLVLGLAGMIFFVVFEAYWAQEPIAPMDLLSSPTSLSGFVGTFLTSATITALLYYLPVFAQACYGATPLQSGIEVFGLSFSVVPSGIIAGASVGILKRYVPQNYIGWSVTILGLGLSTLLRPDTSVAKFIGFEIVLGIGMGFAWSASKFPFLAPQPLTRTAKAVALFAFVQVFAQTFGITIGNAVLQNSLTHTLPPAVSALLPAGTNVAFAGIPLIATLPDGVRQQVQLAFATSLAVLWEVLIGLCGLGLLSCFMMREIAMHTKVDDRFDMETRLDSEQVRSQRDCVG